MPILLAFLALPIVEIALFVQLGGAIGVFGTLLEIFASGALGVFLMRLEPYRNGAEIRAALASERGPASPMAHSAMRMVGALLLVLPGFLTDGLGLLLLVPVVRTLVLRRVLIRGVATSRPAARDDIIEGEFSAAPDPDATDSRDRLPPRPTDRDYRD